MSDFVIENGILTKYTGPGGDVVIPDGVVEIGRRVFLDKSVTCVTMPESVTNIGIEAFRGCTQLKTVYWSAGLRKIEENAFRECGLNEVILPESVVTIRGGAFRSCQYLTKVILPKSLINISMGDWRCGGAFAECEQLCEFVGGSSDLVLTNGVFGWYLPKGLEMKMDEWVFRMEDTALQDYVNRSGCFEKLKPENQVTLMLSKQGKAMLNSYIGKKLDWGRVAEIICQQIHDKYTVRECNAVAKLLVSVYDNFSDAQLQKLYRALESLKNATKAKQTIADCGPLSKKLNLMAPVDENLTGPAKLVAEQLMSAGKTQKELETEFKNFYSITVEDLPVLKDNACGQVNPIVFAWLMTAHEVRQSNGWASPDVYAGYKKPGIRPEAAPIVALLDHDAFMDALRKLAKNYLGITGRSKKMFLAYPICRYADETLMAELTKTAPSWRSSVSGNEVPPLWTFRDANIFNNTRAAMLFADKYGELDIYAEARGTDADTLRDQYLSDVGLDADSGKTYDLGNQTVVARLQDDLSFLVELPNGKTAKSLPKKGADEALYATANADFSEMKKAVKRILKNRNTTLLQDFLTNKKRDADAWNAAYLGNVLLRRAAKLLVWVQDKQTFTVADKGLICADGTEYMLTDKKVALAHPMDMKKEDVAAWQNYFTTHGLKQPFEQIWEPTVDPATVQPDRYKGCMIPYYRFTGQTKRGIHVEDWDFHNEIDIRFDDCDAEVERIDWARHEISPNHNFEVTHFAFKKYTRKVNHIVAYLDKVTVFGRIAKDDVSIADRLDAFTLAQIAEFIEFATKQNCTGCAALLLEYKQTHFPDADPMDTFVLEW